MKAILVLYSYHHKNTEKIAGVFAKALEAQIRSPQQIRPDELQDYDLVGFGSGIYGENFHRSIVELAEKLPPVTSKKAFLFSTNGAPVMFFGSPEYSPSRSLFEKNHARIKEILENKGYTIAGVFSCPGFNTNRFLIHIGGLNKGRPNAEDLRRAEEFALGLKDNVGGSGIIL